jgi:hypothetical protein
MSDLTTDHVIKAIQDLDSSWTFCSCQADRPGPNSLSIYYLTPAKDFMLRTVHFPDGAVVDALVMKQ